MVKAEGTEARNRIEVFKDHYAVKEDAKSVVWRGAWFHHLIEKAQIVESARRSDKGLADRVKAGTSRTKECAESIVGRRHLADAKVTSDRRRCGGPAGESARVSKSPLVMRFALGGLSYAQPEQAHQCQDAVKNMFSRCHSASPYCCLFTDAT